MGLPLSQIGSRLEALFSELKGDENAYARAANVNVIVITSKGSDAALVEALSLVRPSRFFLVTIDDSLNEIQVEVSAQCHSVGYVASEGHYVCSEIVTLKGTKNDLEKIAGIIRANVMPGMPVEFVISDATLKYQNISPLIELSERIYFNGSNFSFDNLEKLSKLKIDLVDLEWIRLNAWREEIRTAYSQLAQSGLQAGQLQSVTNVFSNRVSAFILTGWIASRLGLKVAALGGSGVECVGPDGEKTLIQLKEGSPPSLTLQFKIGQIDLSESGDTLNLSVKGSNSHQSRHSVRKEGDIELLKRYLLIGESTSNYRNALQVAIDIDSLDKRFRQ